MAMAVMRAGWIAALAIVAATGAGAEPLSDGLKKATDCMLQILKTTPGVSEPKIDIARDSVCVEYRPHEKSVWENPTRFCLNSDYGSLHTPYIFNAFFPGATVPGGKLDIHVSASVMEKWNKKCGVSASGVFD